LCALVGQIKGLNKILLSKFYLFTNWCTSELA